MATRTASAPRSVAVPANEYCSTLRIRTAKPINGCSDVSLNVIADARMGDAPPSLHADLVDLCNGYHLVFGRAEFYMLGPALDRCERLAVAALAAGKVYRPAGETRPMSPALSGEFAADIYVEGAAR